MKKSQVTAEKTAWLEVISHAQSHLGSSKARARYDRTLTQQAEETFEGLVEFAIKGLTRLDPSTHAALVEEAAAAGIGADRADRLIGRACRRLGVSRERGSVMPLAGQSSAGSTGGAPALGNGATKYSLLRCRHCSGVTEQSPVAQIGHGALPALRGVAELELSGLQARSLGQRKALLVRLSPGAS